MKKQLFISAVLMALAIGGLAGCKSKGKTNPSGSPDPSTSPSPSQVEFEEVDYSTYITAASLATKLPNDLNWADADIVSESNGKTRSGSITLNNADDKWILVRGDAYFFREVSDMIRWKTADDVDNSSRATYYYAKNYGFAYKYENTYDFGNELYSYCIERIFNKFGMLVYLHDYDEHEINGQKVTAYEETLSISYSHNDFEYERVDYDTFHNAAVKASKLSNDLNHADVRINDWNFDSFNYQDGEWHFVEGDDYETSSALSYLNMTADTIQDLNYARYYYDQNYGFRVIAEEYNNFAELHFNEYGMIDYLYVKVDDSDMYYVQTMSFSYSHADI